jgi:hypothetical protein
VPPLAAPGRGDKDPDALLLPYLLPPLALSSSSLRARAKPSCAGHRMAPSFRPPPRPSVPPIGSASPPATSPSKESTGEGRNRRPRLLLLRGRPSSPWPPWRLPASSGLSEPSVALVVSLRCSGAPPFAPPLSVACPRRAAPSAAVRPRRRPCSGGQ